MSSRQDGEASWAAVLAASRKPSGYFYTRYLNRPAARLFTYIGWRLGLRPVHLTLAGGALTFAGLATVLLVSIDQRGWLVLSYGVLAVGFILDSADGQLARASGRTSRSGGFLDHTLDGGKVALAGVAIGSLGGTAGIVWGAMLATSMSIHFTATWQRDAIGVTPERGEAEQLSPLYVAKSLMDYGVLLLFLLVAASMARLFLLLFQIYVVAYTTFTLLFVRRAYGQIGDRSANVGN
jgi:phosphatidylglycerophosphate synthase